MYRCTLSGVTFTFMPRLNLASTGYNCFCKVITTRLAFDSFTCFANCASLRFAGHTYKTGSFLADKNAH